MLESAAGPFPIIDFNTGAHTGFSHEPVLIPGAGLFGYLHDGTYAVVKLDGTALHRRGDYTAGISKRDLRADLRFDSGVRSETYYSRYQEFDYFTGQAIGEQFSPGSSRPYYGLAERSVYLNNGQLLSHPGIAHQDTVEEAYFAGGSGYGCMSLSRNPNVVVFVDEGGNIFRYDHEARQLAAPRTGIGQTCRYGWWDRELGIYLTLHAIDGDADELRLWTPDPAPAAISAPVTDDQVGRGRAVEYKVAVTGSYGEPVPGIEVAWSTAGGGSLANAVTRTDADGVARNGYLATDEASSEPTITAEVSA